jgi:RNA polymerase sigma factor (sigma-70 family)
MSEELKLIEACKRKDHSAFEWLYHKYAPKMKMVAYRYVGDMACAEDVLHDAFIKIYERIGQLKDVALFEAWLRRIVVNEAIDFLKKKKKLKKIMEESGQLSDHLQPETTNIYQGISLKELMETLDSLPAGYRMIFNLHVIDGMPHQDIAESLGITEGTSKSQLARAKELLRKLLTRKLQFNE